MKLISIAMTTYNGAKYIIKQLDSLRQQTRKPDEVIIFDDCSKDKTVEITLEYIQKWNLTGWTIKSNKNNLGWKRNFYAALKCTKGDIVFFCDQDDIWENNKIEKMCDVLEEKDIDVLCCTSSFIDGDDRKITVTREALPYGAIKGSLLRFNSVNKKFIYTIMPGCTMAIKRNYIQRLAFALNDEEISSMMPHDALFWKMATLENKAAILNIDLVKYRIHTNNTSSPQTGSSYKVKSKLQRTSEINKNLLEITLIRQIYISLKGSKYIELLDDLISFCEWRKSFVNNKKVINIHKYLKYYRSIKMLLGDVAAAIN